ncbi:NADH dehydrogenase I chain L [Bdellovibrio bacteriovorus HD100]|uniref:NADH dehydrogenase I chain L n=2 Tax=Bdellovibrio bacteriovorus TaxID=959 RepID=Q6MGN6_BDEBA|nr:NADH-quinone oxidoreductase subunit L [Bdellovibrio bacteriovorus]CAE81243.1 NADH dehydrogenase I chain L [Bdellovibrio bacteriovorus HD100]
MNHSLLMAILILAPFIGFLINGARYKKHSGNVAGSIATVAVAISFISAILLVVDLVSMPAEARRIAVSFFEWMAIDKFKVNAGFVVDQISAIMILVITGVGTLIHLFSIGYMHHDKGVAKYFAYLNLFIFNMLLLVLGDSLLVMFVGWEGVGLCSYLLIGFWFTDKEKAAAGMKAFITNRIGDAAFLLGMFVLFITFGTLNFSELNALAPTVAESSWLGALTLGTMFLFIGATGKSAQIPLYVWLPDAMAGPTPVSALIHAATMVTAGVYMIVRLNPLFIMAPNTMMVIAIIGAATAVFAATIGITQNDIKKVLAYSTVSQLGYMFLAAGVGAFGAAMFHLMTHAFFKALMFLGSGSVIHGMHEEQDIRKMGGLKKYMPITHITFLMGWLAIIGTPLFSGFFSKDEILAYAFHSPMGSPILWAAGVLGATLTAFYMTRLMALTFWGKSRVSADVHPHESSAIMTIPLIILAILSVIAGWIGVPHVIGEHLGHMPNFWEHWLHPLISPIPGWTAIDHTTEWVLMGCSVGLATVSAIVAYQFYVKSPETPKKIAESIKPVYNMVYNKYFVDEAYFGFIINPLVTLSKNTWYYIDVNFIDKMTFWAGDLVRGMGSFARSIQTGNMQQYAMYIGIGVVVALSFVIMR